MLAYILGIIIDLDGNYLSFGTWDHTMVDAGYEYFTLHGRSCLTAILESGWLFTHKDLCNELQDIDFDDLKVYTLDKDIDSAIYDYFSRFSELGYTVILNGSSDMKNMTFGYLPHTFTQFQEETLLLLKKDIWYHNEMSDLYIAGTDCICVSIAEIYASLEQKSRTLCIDKL